MNKSSPKSTGLLPTVCVSAGLLLLLLGERMLGPGTLGGVCSAAGVAVVLVAVALRVGSFLRTTGDQRHVELRLLWAYGGVLAGLGLYALTTSAGISAWEAVLRPEPAAASRIEGVLMALWPAVLTVALSATLFMELVYARMPIPASVELRRVRAAAHAGLTLAFSIVFLFSLNYVAAERDLRKDFSYFKTTRPGEATQNLVTQLDAPVTVTLFFPKANDVLDQLRPYFDELAKRSSKLTVRAVDHALVPDLAKTYRIRGNGFVLLSRDDDVHEDESPVPRDPDVDINTARARERARKAQTKGETIEIGTELHVARGALRKLDGLFQQRLTKLTLTPRQLHLTVGHAERNTKITESAPGEGMANFSELLQRLNIKSQSLGVAQGLAQMVPETASAVAVFGPREPFMPEEAEALLQYVRDGGRLVVLVDPDVDHGLDPLLAGLGLELLPGILTSDRHHMRRTHTSADRVLVYSNHYSSHPTVSTVNRHAREVATIFYRGGALQKRDVPGEGAPKVTFPLRSAPEFWLDLDGDLEKGSDETAGGMQMMAAVTLPRTDGEEGRAVVIADGDLLTDKLIANAGNHLLFVDALAWLIGEEKIVGDVASEEDVPIEHTREEDKLWFYATTFAVPLPVLVLGVVMMRRRRGRRAADTRATSGAPPADQETKRAA